MGLSCRFRGDIGKRRITGGIEWSSCSGWCWQQTKKWRPTNKSEIKQFFGLQIMMGNLKLPRIEMFYGKHFKCKMFEEIPEYRFYLLRTNIHLIDVEKIPENCTDKFVRVRPLMDSVRKRCLELPLEENLAIDEQMIPLRGRVSKGVKQYVKNKPKIKWGVWLRLLSRVVDWIRSENFGDIWISSNDGPAFGESYRQTWTQIVFWQLFFNFSSIRNFGAEKDLRCWNCQIRSICKATIFIWRRNEKKWARMLLRGSEL